MGTFARGRTESRPAPSRKTCETHIMELDSPCHLRDKMEKDSCGNTVPRTLRQTCSSGLSLMGLGLSVLMRALMDFGIILDCSIPISSLCDDIPFVRFFDTLDVPDGYISLNLETWSSLCTIRQLVHNRLIYCKSHSIHLHKARIPNTSIIVCSKWLE